MVEKNEYNKNKVSIFLVPALGINPSELKALGFINGYVMDIHCEKEYNNCLFLLFKPEQQLTFGSFIESQAENIVGEYDYPDGFTVLVFNFPIKYLTNYNYFMEGKYSRFTEEYKRLFTKVVSAEERQEGLIVTEFVRTDNGMRTNKALAVYPLAWATFYRPELIREDLERILGQSLPKDSEVVSYYSEKWDVLDFYTLFDKQKHEPEPQ